MRSAICLVALRVPWSAEHARNSNSIYEPHLFGRLHNGCNVGCLKGRAKVDAVYEQFEIEGNFDALLRNNCPELFCRSK